MDDDNHALNLIESMGWAVIVVGVGDCLRSWFAGEGFQSSVYEPLAVRVVMGVFLFYYFVQRRFHEE